MSEQDGGVEAIIAKQRLDLIAYLTRVRGLPAPSWDLVFMHSESGVASGLEAATSDRLAAMAKNGQAEGLVELLASLPAAQQQAAVATLARWSGSFALAQERRNTVTVLLAAAAAVADLDSAGTAQVAGAVLAAPGELPTGALADTVRLAGRCRPVQRRQLVAGLKARDDLAGDAKARADLIASFPSFEDADNLYGLAVAMAIGDRDEPSTKEIIGLAEGDQEKLMALAEPTVLGWIESAKSKAENPPEGEEPGDTTSVNGWLLPALEICEGSKAAATRIASWLLKAGNSAADQAVEERLRTLAPIEDPALSVLMLERLRARMLAARAAWLEAIGPDSIDPVAAAQLDAAARQLWIERTTGDPDADDFAEAIEALSTLARSLAPEQREFPNLDAEIATSTEVPMQDDASADERLRLSAAASEFVELELADTTKSADRFIVSVQGAMEVLSPGELDQAPQLRAAVRKLLSDWLDDASPSALQGLREAATQGPESQLDATKAEALIGATGKLREDDEEIAAPLAPAAVGALARDYGERADSAIVAWLTYFDDLWALLEPMWPTQISPTQRQQFEAASKRLPAPSHRELAIAAFDHTLASGSPPPPSNWEAIALRDLSGSWVVSTLAERRPEGEELERWRILLEIARQRVLSGSAKALVASELLEPLAAAGSDGALGLALDHLELAGRPSAETMIKGLALSSTQAEMVEAKIKQLGWKKGGLSGLLRDLVGGGDEHRGQDDDS